MCKNGQKCFTSPVTPCQQSQCWSTLKWFVETLKLAACWPSERLKGCQDSKCVQQNAPKLRYCSFGSLCFSSLQNITVRASPVRHPTLVMSGNICHTLVRVILPWRLAFRVHFYNSYSAKRKMCRMCLMELWKFRFVFVTVGIFWTDSGHQWASHRTVAT